MNWIVCITPLVIGGLCALLQWRIWRNVKRRGHWDVTIYGDGRPSTSVWVPGPDDPFREDAQ